jgi:ribosome biogenesis GTPase
LTAAPLARPEPEVGCVLGQEVGVLVVLTDDGPLRVTYGAQMLAAIARDRGCVPEPGEWVALRRWPDGPVTVEGTVYRLAARRPLATVLTLRRPA